MDIPQSLYIAKQRRYTECVTLLKPILRRLLWAGILVAGFHFALEILLQATEYSLTYWPAILARLGLIVLGGPAQLAANWAFLHLGSTLVPQLVWDLLLALLYIEVWINAKKLKTVLTRRPDLGRRAVLAGGATLAVGAAGLNYSSEVQIVRRSFTMKDLPPGLKGLKVALLADLHRGPVVSYDYLEGVVKQVNSLEPDLILLPGDFVSKSNVYFADVTKLLKQLRPRIASLATLGNHDHWEGTEEAIACVKAAGVELLHNSALHLTPERQLTRGTGSSGLCLAGVDDVWTGRPDLSQALAGVDQGVPCLLLSHNPDFAEDEAALATGLRVDLQVSGHTHGGQVVLPGVGPATTGSDFGLKYIYGEAQGPAWKVFTTRGIGTSIVPVRVGAPPEIVLFELA